METNQAKLAVDGGVNAAGEFEIMAITAGEGNGWQWSEVALRESLALWNGAECFVDHSLGGHSLRDLGGILHGAAWDAERKGVTARLRAVGPSAGLVNELGRQMLADGAKPRVGFSADVLFSAEGRKVNKILRVLSVDLVFNPARGGAFLRALNSLEAHGVDTMADEVQEVTGGLAAQLQGDVAAMRTLLDVQAERAKLALEADEARKLRVQMCGYLLDSALTGARLPKPAADQVRKQLSGQVFEAETLNAAIEDARNLVAALTAGSVVAGPGRVHAVFSSEDQLQAAVDDLLGAPREAGQENVKTARLSGIRELYLMLTGDDNMHGGYYAEHARLATTADFSGLVKNALNKVVADAWAELGRAGYEWWKPIVTVEHCNTLNQVTGILVGTVGDLPTVAEGAAYSALVVGDSPEVGNFTKYGGYIPLTLELIDRDETRKLRAYPRQLANAGLRKVSSQIAAIFTAAAGVGPTMADGGALFNIVASTVAGGHANLRTVALGAPEWDVTQTAVYNQRLLISNGAGVIGTGPKTAINPRFLLVPRTLELIGKQVLYPQLERTATINSENQQRGHAGDVITVPEWTDANDWAAVVDPRVAPAIYVGERFGLMPEIFIAGGDLSPAVFTNDEHRMKVRHFLAVWVADYRPLHKSNVV